MFLPSPILIFLAGVAHAQFPSAPVDLEVITSELNSDVTLSYKEVPGHLCETTSGARTFSGYVHLPQKVLTDLSVDFDINTYFLFFEARNDPENAPLVIYLAGGPGESSTFTAMSSEGGPCYVNLDGNSTTLNPWSFNNHANMLYLDQPVSAGFSYTSLVNGTFSLMDNEIVPLTEYDGAVPESLLLGQGTFVDPTPWKTTNTSVSSAKALWHFAQHWLSQFPEYKSNNKKIGIWGNSHGGYWAPATAAYFDKKLKELRPNSPLREWSVDNVGITNGVIDLELDLPFWPEYNFNNTYKPLITEEDWESATANFSKEDGCQQAIRQCRAIAAEGDPEWAGTNETVNAACRNATAVCRTEVGGTLPLEVSPFDIAVSVNVELGMEPCTYYLPVINYLNQEWTQKALGVPLNFTYISNAVLQSYTLLGEETADKGTGDPFRTDRSNVDYITQNDIKLALVYGDRDARCPWLAAEHFSHNSNYSDSDSWSAAGYEYITTNDTYQGGVVKQFDKVSFSRVFQAGHAVNAYQPETVDRIFQRTLFGKDVATGKKDASDGYSSKGPESSLDMVNETLPEVPDTCMVLGSFQDSSPWEPLFEAAVAAESGNSTGDSTDSSSSATESSEDSSSTSMSARVQPAGLVALLFFVAAGLGLAV